MLPRGIPFVGVLVLLAAVAPTGTHGASGHNPLAGFAPPPPLVVNLTPNSSVLDLGQNLTLRASVSGGSGVATNWAYTWAGLPPGCTSSNSNTTSCTPTTNATWSVTVTVDDSATHQKTTSTPASVVVNPRPHIAAFTSSAGHSITSGYNFTMSVLVSGGTAPFAYAYTGLFSNCTGTTTSTVVCHAGSAGNYTFRVTMTDAVGVKNTSAYNLTVTPVPGAYVPPPVTPGHTTSQSRLGAATYAEIAAILGVGALAVAALLVKARRDERQTFRAVPTAETPAAPGSTLPPISSDKQTTVQESKPGGKSE